MPAALQNYSQNPGTYYYVNDHLGTPQQLITATGLVVWQAAYLPYGEAQVRINLVENNLRFPGQYFDAETGLHYNWNRYYDAQTGRYISADPIGLNGGMNVYAYVVGNPVNEIDPEGLDTICDYKEYENMRVDGDPKTREYQDERSIIRRLAEYHPRAISFDAIYKYIEVYEVWYRNKIIEEICIDECTKQFISNRIIHSKIIDGTRYEVLLEKWRKPISIIMGNEIDFDHIKPSLSEEWQRIHP